MKQKLYTKTFTLTPGECNGQQEMSLSFLVGRIIKVASLHADSWGVGYEKMIEKLEPTHIICYGNPFKEMQGNLIIVDYDKTRKVVR